MFCIIISYLGPPDHKNSKTRFYWNLFDFNTTFSVGRRNPTLPPNDSHQREMTTVIHNRIERDEFVYHFVMWFYLNSFETSCALWLPVFNELEKDGCPGHVFSFLRNLFKSFPVCGLVILLRRLLYIVSFKK